MVILVTASNEPKPGRATGKAGLFLNLFPPHELSKPSVSSGFGWPYNPWFAKEGTEAEAFSNVFFPAFTSGTYYKVHSLALQWFGD